LNLRFDGALIPNSLQTYDKVLVNAALPLHQMLSRYRVLSLSIHHASLEQIGNFVIGRDALPKVYDEIEEKTGISQMMYLATCNRVCFFYYSEGKYDLKEEIRIVTKVLSARKENTQDVLSTHFHNYSGSEAINFLMRMASSVDSLVIGEREIFRQMRQAFSYSADLNFVGFELRLAMKYVVEQAKLAFSSTGIGDKPVSVVSLAFRKLRSLHPSNSSRVLIIGAGQTNTLFGKFIKDYGFSNITVCNRSIGPAQRLASMLNANVLEWADLHAYSLGFDIMVVCTSAENYIIDQALYAQLLGSELDRKILIDLSVPYNIDPNIADQFNANLIEVSQLKVLAAENLNSRQSEVSRVLGLTDQAAKNFENEFLQRTLLRAMDSVPSQMQDVKTKAIKQVFKKELDSLDSDTLELFSRFADYITKGCADLPMKAVKQSTLSRVNEKQTSQV